VTRDGSSRVTWHGKNYLLSVQKKGREREARLLRVASMALFGLPTSCVAATDKALPVVLLKKNLWMIIVSE
jgi:hypothetical protein